MFSVAVIPQTTFGNNVNASKVVKQLEHLQEVFRSNSDFQVIEAFVKKMVEAAQDMAPYRTGRLMRSIKMEKVANGYRFFQDSREADYGVYHEFGTRRIRRHAFFGPAEERYRNPMREALLKYYRGKV